MPGGGIDMTQKPIGGCACKSNGRPSEPWQTDEMVGLDPSPYFPWQEPPETVYVDACIAPVIVALWKGGVWTLNSCCGHSEFYGKHVRRTVIISNPMDRERAEQIVSDLGDTAEILAWELMGRDGRSETLALHELNMRDSDN